MGDRMGSYNYNTGFTDEKGALQSMTCSAGVIAIASGVDQVLGLLGIVPPGLVPATVNAGCAVVAGVMAIWGRLRAKHKIVGLM